MNITLGVLACAYRGGQMHAMVCLVGIAPSADF